MQHIYKWTTHKWPALCRLYIKWRTHSLNIRLLNPATIGMACDTSSDVRGSSRAKQWAVCCAAVWMHPHCTMLSSYSQEWRVIQTVVSETVGIRSVGQCACMVLCTAILLCLRAPHPHPHPPRPRAISPVIKSQRQKR